MYIGHYGVAYALKAKNRQIPLWLLFISVQFIDLLAFILIIFGIERIHYTGNNNPFLRTVIEYLPYSHSLSFNLIYALITFLLFWKFINLSWGIVLSSALLSHWFIDLLFQKNNLPLYFDSFKVGFGLWDFPLFSIFCEIIFIIFTSLFLYANNKYQIKYFNLIILNILLTVYFCLIMFVPEPENLQNSQELKSLAILIPYIIFTIIAYFAEIKKSSKPRSS